MRFIIWADFLRVPNFEGTLEEVLEKAKEYMQMAPNHGMIFIQATDPTGQRDKK